MKYIKALQALAVEPVPELMAFSPEPLMLQGEAMKFEASPIHIEVNIKTKTGTVPKKTLDQLKASIKAALPQITIKVTK